MAKVKVTNVNEGPHPKTIFRFGKKIGPGETIEFEDLTERQLIALRATQGLEVGGGKKGSQKEEAEDDDGQAELRYETVEEAEEGIAAIDDTDELARRYRAEASHPSYKKGRKGVLEAVEARLSELGIEKPKQFVKD